MSQPGLAVVAFQTGLRSDGGLTSLTEIVLRLKRYRPFIITQQETPFCGLWRNAGIAVHVVPVPSPFSAIGRPASRMRRVVPMVEANIKIADILRAQSAAVVHCNDVSALWHSFVAARACNRPIVFNIRDTTGVGGLKWRLTGQIPDEIVFLSADMKARLAGALGRSGDRNLGFIHSIVDPDKFAPADRSARAKLREELGMRPNVFSVGVIGACVERKQQLQLLNAIDVHSATADKIMWYFVGDCDPHKSEYAALCTRAAVGKPVRMTGYSSRTADWYKALDLVVVVSRSEGLARCMIEALASGVPVISFDVCSAREILETNQCGAVVSQADFPALLRIVDELRRNPALLSEMSSRAIATARRLFDPDKAVERYQEVYDGLITS